MLSFDWFFHFYYKIFSRSFGNAFLDFIFMLEPKQNKKTISCFIFTVKTQTCLVMTLSNTELQYTLSLWCLELLYFIISFSVSVSVWNFVWLFAVLFIARFESILYLRHSTIKKSIVWQIVKQLFDCDVYVFQSLQLSQRALSETAPGKLANLLSNDVNRFEIVSLVLHPLWTSPLMTIVATYILWQETRWAGMIGLLTVFLIVPIQSKLATTTIIINIHFILKCVKFWMSRLK